MTVETAATTVPGETAPQYTWEQAVEWLRSQPGQQGLVRDCYFDDPLSAAAQRFATSDEWRATTAWLPAGPGQVLELGAGRGIASYALAVEGWHVTALEPDPSPLVGAAAIESLSRETGLPIDVVQQPAESLPFEDATFDLVFGRQVLHHAADLPSLCREVRRVLKTGGMFVATREHVVSNQQELTTFLDQHPLHRMYGGEHACLLNEYVEAIGQSGLRLNRVLGHYDSVVNYFPMTFDQWCERCRRPMAATLGPRIAGWLASPRHAVGGRLLRRAAGRLSRECTVPGRLYSFVARCDDQASER